MMPTPIPPRGADSVYRRHESGGPGMSEGALWTDYTPPLVAEALQRPWMSRSDIRALPNPLPQIMLFPPRHGFDQHEPTIEDVLAVRRFHTPMAPVGQDGGGAIATSNPANYSWW